MELSLFNRFVAQASESGVVFYHSGNLDEATIASIGALLRRRLHEEGADGAQSRKVFATFMEMAQNILHYGAACGDGRHGALCVARTDQGFEVMCGNDMASDQVPRVRKRLESVQAMEPGKVRQAYRRQLASDPDPPRQDGTTFLFLRTTI